MAGMHGGDIYTNKVQLDFSVNINPLGIPKEVQQALKRAVGKCRQYPDINASALRHAVAGMLNIPEESLIFGNGASELFMAVMHAIRPDRVLLPVPSFYGYEYAAVAVQSRIHTVYLKEDRQYLPDEELFGELTEDIDVLFLANPNNPTGQRMEKSYIKKLLELCREKEILVILDECFIEFCGEEYSMMPETGEYDNLLIVRAFTKSFAIPGVRLGYLVSSNRELRNNIKAHLPEWNLSAFAQEAGIACAAQKEYLGKTREYIRTERKILSENLKNTGIRVFDGEADFLLIYTDIPLYGELLKRGILIRDCQNFRGLTEGYYRVAVKTREENIRLWKEAGECIEENRAVIAGRNRKEKF